MRALRGGALEGESPREPSKTRALRGALELEGESPQRAMCYFQSPSGSVSSASSEFAFSFSVAGSAAAAAAARRVSRLASHWRATLRSATGLTIFRANGLTGPEWN